MRVDPEGTTPEHLHILADFDTGLRLKVYTESAEPVDWENVLKALNDANVTFLPFPK
jgi:hypothetical protein